MKKIIALLLMVLAVSCLAQPGRKWSWPTGEIHVDAQGREGVRTIAQAVSWANSVSDIDVIVIHPGTYTENGVIFSRALTITGIGANDTSVVWEGDSLLWSLNADGVVFNNIYFKALLDGQLANVSTKDWRANNCSFDCSTWTFAKDDANFVHWRDVHLYPRKMAGTKMTNGTVYCEERFISGVPVGEPSGPYYGLYFTSGLFHAEDKVNIYANTDTVLACMELVNDANVALQGGGLIGVQGAHAKSIGVRLRSTATFLMEGGDIQNNSADSAAVRILAGTAVATIRFTKVTNSGGGESYCNGGTGASELYHSIFVGDITLGANDTYNDFTGNVYTVNTHILPDADVGADLGTLGTQFDSLFVDDIDADNIVADDIMVNTTFTVGVSGTLVNAIYRGHAAYTTTAIFDTVLQAGIDNGDYLYWSFANTAKIGSPDAVMSAWISANGDTIFAERAAGGTSGLKWDWKVETVP